MGKTWKKARSLVACCLAAALGVGTLSGAAPAGRRDATAYKQGVWAEYYQGTTDNAAPDYTNFLTGQKIDAVDFAWSASVTPPGLSTQEFFSTRYAGRILAPETGTYILYLNIDDGAKLWFDGEVKINDAGPHGAAEAKASVDLTAGQYYDFVIEHYNAYGDGTLQFSWRTPDNVKERIPASAYFMPETARVELVVDGNTVRAEANVQTAGDDDMQVVLESRYTGTDAVVDSKTADRERDAHSFSTDLMAYEEGKDYTAYVTSDGEIISKAVTKEYGVDAQLTVDTNQVENQITETMYGVCMEDVNHELYGGIWSQMVFGESFAEPAYNNENAAISIVGGDWAIEDDGEGGRQYAGSGSDGPKLILNPTTCTVGEVSADVYFTGGGPTGFIVKVSDPKPGADSFYGYEVGLGNGFVRLAKHENNYNKINDYSCNVQPGNWYNVRVAMTADTITVFVDGVQAAQYTDPNPIKTGMAGFRVWDGAGKFKNIQFGKDGGEMQPVPVEENLEGGTVKVSGMWRLHQDEGVTGAPDLVTDAPYTASLSAQAQSQRITFTSGEGRIGVNNMGLNRMGMNFEADKEYEGYFYARSEEGAEAYVVLENADGTKKYAEKAVQVEAGYGWKRYAFTLTPDTKDTAGRLSIELRKPGSVDLGYAFLEMGEWGRFNGLHVRKDVAEKLIEQNVSIIRFGGGMIGAKDYRWKNMLGAPENRPTYDGTWYKTYSSLGFAIPEILMLCEELGIPCVPDFNIDESPEDMADFMDFALGTDTENQWVQARIALGHPEPFELPYIQLGNENGIDDTFAAKFNAIADKIWEKADEYGVEPVLIVGDFGYAEPIVDPYNLSQADSGVLTLAGHKKILDHAVESGDREVWVDVHVFTDEPSGAYNFGANFPSLYNALKSICPASKVKITVFELNAWVHEFRRVLGNAVATMTGEDMGDVFPIVCSANALQVDGQNDNGWDQGLIFMNSEKAWLQPPAYATQMMHNAYQPNRLAAVMDNKLPGVIYNATGSEDGDTVVVKMVNDNPEPVSVRMDLGGFTGNVNTATVTTMANADRKLTNTAENPTNAVPATETFENPVQNGQWIVTLPANSFAVFQIEKKSEPAVQTLEEAKAAVDAALERLAVNNDTAAGDILATVQQVVINKDITAAWTKNFALTPATAEAEGSITGEITLTLGDDTAVVQIDKTIAKLEGEIVSGDLDKDGKVTIADVMEACKVLARKSAEIDPTDGEIARGDLDGDQDVTIADVMEICKILARQN